MRLAEALRRRHGVLLTIFILVLVMLGMDQLYRLVRHIEVNWELRAFRKDGYLVPVAELGKGIRTVPDAQNGALKILDAADYVALLPDGLRPERWPARGEEMGPAERDNIRGILTNSVAALEMLHAATHLRESRFPLDYSEGPEMRLSHLAKVKALAQLLKAEAYLCSEEGQPERAARSILDGVWLARSVESEPLLISQWVRIHCLAMGCSSLQRLLGQHALSPVQLDAISEAFGGAADSTQAAFRGVLRSEMCLGVFCFTRPPWEVLPLLNPEGPSSAALVKSLYPLYTWTGLRERDFLYYLRTMRQMINAANLSYPEGLAKAKEIRRRTEQDTQSYRLRMLSGMLLPVIQGAMGRSAEVEALLRCAQAAMGVEHYRHEHSALPETLMQLAPAVITRIPADPIDGAPLRYRKLTQTPGYLVYSLGLDRVDSGGLGKSPHTDFWDWKWPPGHAEVDFIDIVLTVER